MSSWPDYSIKYAIPYLLLGLLVLILGYKKIWNDKVKVSNWKYVTLFIVFLLFFGLRWHILSDSLAYEQEFNTIRPNFTWQYIDAHSLWWDKGFVIFAMLVKLIDNDWAFFVFVNSFIDITIFTLCLKKYHVNVFLCLLSFLAFQGILTELNLFRNIKAILLFIYSLSYIQDRKLVKFLVINIIGFTFHSSALLFIPMYWILNRRYPSTPLYIALGIFTVIYVAQIDVLENYLMSLTLSSDSAAADKFSFYLNQGEESVFSIGFLERLLTLGLTLNIYKKIKNNGNSFNLIIANSFFVFYILYSLFGFNAVFRDRIPYLFIYSYWFLYPYLFRYYTKGRKIIAILFFALFFGKIYLSTHVKSAYYETIMFHETTRSERERLLDLHQ